MHIMVVDDNSPDGTAEVAREAGRRWGNVHLLRGEKRGLGVAYVRGLEHSLRPVAGVPPFGDEVSASVLSASVLWAGPR